MYNKLLYFQGLEKDVAACGVQLKCFIDLFRQINLQSESMENGKAQSAGPRRFCRWKRPGRHPRWMPERTGPPACFSQPSVQFLSLYRWWKNRYIAALPIECQRLDWFSKCLLMDLLIGGMVAPTKVEGGSRPAAIVPQITKQRGKEQQYGTPNPNINFCGCSAHFVYLLRAKIPLIMFSTAPAMIKRIQEKLQIRKIKLTSK